MANRSFLSGVLLGCFALPPPSRAEAPSFHLVLSDGNDQLNGRSPLVAEKVSREFRKMGIEVTWSFNPSDPSSPDQNVVNVIVLPHAGESWGMTPGALAAVRRDYDSRARVFVFYRELERILDLTDSRATRSILGHRSPGRRMVDGVSRVIMHEVLHFFLPGRPHDTKGLFRSHVNGNVLDRSSFEIPVETRKALAGALLQGSTQDRFRR